MKDQLQEKANKELCICHNNHVPLHEKKDCPDSNGIKAEHPEQTTQAKPDNHTGEGKTCRWIFDATNEEKEPIQILIKAGDRESAIAYFEAYYPQYKWWATSNI